MEIDSWWLFLFVSSSCFGGMQKSDTKELPIVPLSVIQACWNGNAQWIESFLDEGGDPNAIDGTGLTLFARACARGNKQVVKRLMDHPSFNSKISLEYMSGGKTPLMWAAWTGKNDIVKLLATHKNLLEARDDERASTPLILAVQTNEVDCVESLLVAGVNIFARDKAKRQARDYAQKFKYTEIITLLNTHQKKRKNEKKQKRLTEKEGYEFISRLDTSQLQELEDQNAAALASWCAIQ